jgi:hypothetical protein
MTLREIKQAAYLNHNVIFTDKDAQDVIDTKPEWIGEETAADAVADYLDAFGK